MKSWPFLVAAMLLLLAAGMSEAEENHEENSVEKREGAGEGKPEGSAGLKDKWKLAIETLKQAANDTWKYTKEKWKKISDNIASVFGKKPSERRAL